MVRDALAAVCGLDASYVDPIACGSARRVHWWHRLLFFRPVTIVFRAGERAPQASHGELGSAARSLASMGYKVLIDSPLAALPDNAKGTLRAKMVEVEARSYDTLCRMQAFQPLVTALRDLGLDRVVFEALGGVPAHYEGLLQDWEEVEYDKGRLEAVANAYVGDQIGMAIEHRDLALADKTLDGIGKVYAKFLAMNGPAVTWVPGSSIIAQGARRPSLDNVLRSVLRPIRVAAGHGSRCWCPSMRRPRSCSGLASRKRRQRTSRIWLSC